MREIGPSYRFCFFLLLEKTSCQAIIAFIESVLSHIAETGKLGHRYCEAWHGEIDTTTWNPKQAFFDGCLVKQPFF